MFDSIKITALPNIGSNLNFESLFPVVDMNGLPDTKKANLQILGNYILTNAGGPNFVQAAQATLAQSVTNAAQPNITSVGTLTSVAVTGNVNLGYLNNITIYGGNNGQYLQTDGNGNLAWVSGGGSGNGEVGGANSQIQFNDSGNFGGDAALTWDAGNAQLNTVKFAASSAIIYVDAAVGNLEANVVKTDNYQYANGDPFTGEYSNANVANYLLDYTGNISAGYFIGNGSQLTGITATAEGAGPNLSIQFNNNGVFDGNSSLTYDLANSTLVSTNLETDNLNAIDATITGNVVGILSLNAANINANYFNGDGSNLTNVVATSANVSNTANSVAVANVVGIGNIATIALDGNGSHILYGNGVFAPVTGGANIGNLEVTGTTIGIANGASETTIVIGANSSSLTLNTDSGVPVVNLQVQSTDSQYYQEISDYTSGTWVVNGLEGQLTINGYSPAFETFLNDLGQYQSYTITVNGSETTATNGYSYGGGNATFYTLLPPGTDPTNVSNIVFNVVFSNKLLMDPDDGTMGIYVGQFTFDIESQRDVRIRAGDDFSITANDSFQMRANSSFQIATDYNNTQQIWSFGTDGNLTLPTNTLAINYLNGSPAFSNMVQWTTAPVSNTSAGTPGQAAYDSGGNLFVCVDIDTWAKFSGTTSW